jgi:5'-nucleotidase
VFESRQERLILEAGLPLLFLPPMIKPQILLTNDDGIHSPGIWAAAAALGSLGRVTVAAPREQSSGFGRSMPSTSTGIIHEEKLQVNGQEWIVYAVNGSPAQSVQHAVLEIMPQKPALVVSGINYGENVGFGVTISGTVGAAMEAASLGMPALAVSLEATTDYHLSYSKELDFSVAAYFTAYFARLLMERELPDDVHLLKVDVPSEATKETPWQVTRLSEQRYYEPAPTERESWDVAGPITYKEGVVSEDEYEDSDVYVLRKKRWVSVTPISLDMTSRVKLTDFEKQLKG